MADRGSEMNSSELARRAARLRLGAGDDEAPALSHEELLETAREVGLEPSELEAVLGEAQQERELSAARAAWISERKAKLARSAPRWALATVLAVAAYWFFGGYAFLLWIVAAWGLLIGARTLKLLSGPSAQELEWKRTELQRQLRSDAGARAALPASQASSQASSTDAKVETPASAESKAFMERLEEERRSRPPLRIHDSGVEGVGAGRSDDDEPNR